MQKEIKQLCFKYSFDSTSWNLITCLIVKKIGIVLSFEVNNHNTVQNNTYVNEINRVY